MPGVVRYAVASAAHNLASTWNGGASVPSAGDTVYLNNFTVTGYAADFDLTTGAPDVNAGSFVTGVFYVIKTVGNTSWTSIGAVSNTVGVGFFATGAGSGSGIATAVGCLTNRSLASPAITGGGTFQAGDGRTLRATTYGPDGAVTAGTVNYTGYTATTVIGDVYPTVSGGTIRVTGSNCYGTLTLTGNLKTQQSGTGAAVALACSSAGASVIVNGNAEPPAATNSNGLNVSAGFNVTFNGTITGGTVAAAVGVSLTCTGTVTVMGPLVGGTPTAPVITGGSAGAGTNAYGLAFTGSGCSCVANIGTASLPGTVTGGSSSGAHAITTITNAVPDITVWAALASGAAGAALNVASTGAKCTVNGNVTASGNAAVAVSNLGAPVVINGNVVGSSSSTGPGLSISTGANVTVNGDINGGSFAGSMGLNDTGAYYVKVNGNVYPGGSGSHGISSSSTSTVIVVNGTCYASNATSGNAAHGVGLTANAPTLYADKLVGCNYGPSNTTIVLSYAAFTFASTGARIFARKTQSGSAGFTAAGHVVYRWADNTNFTDEDVLYNSSGVNYATLKHRFGNSAYVPPTADKVRKNVSYTFGDMIGTASVPSINSVRRNVNIDAAAGVSLVSSADMWNLLNTTTASSGGLMEIIKKASSPEIAASISTSYEY